MMKQSALFLFFLSLSFIVSSVCFGSQYSWHGKWSTTYKEMNLRQNGNNVSGNYGHDNGRIAGQVKGNILEGTWYEDGNQSGKFRFVMAADGKSYTGAWGNNSESPGQTWNGTRTSPVPSAQRKTPLDSVNFNSSWKVEDAANGKNHDYHSVHWTFSIDGTVHGGRLWRGLWGRTADNSIKVILMDSASNTDEFTISFFNNGSEFTVYKNGKHYRYGKKL